MPIEVARRTTANKVLKIPTKGDIAATFNMTWLERSGVATAFTFSRSPNDLGGKFITAMFN